VCDIDRKKITHFEKNKKFIISDTTSDVEEKADTDIDVELCNDLESPPTHIDHRTKVRRQSLNRPRSSSPEDETASSSESVSD
jgi:hypothetical protein